MFAKIPRTLIFKNFFADFSFFKMKKILIQISIFAAVAGLFFGVKFHQKKPPAKFAPPPEISEIEFSRAAQKISLKKSGENWTVENSEKTKSAKKSEVENLLTKLQNLKIESLVSRNAENQKKFYGFSDEQKLAVKMTAKNLPEKFEFFLGSTDPSGKNYFTFGDESTFVLMENLATNFRFDLNFWRTKKVFEIPTEIEKVAISAADLNFKKNENWDEKVDKFLSDAREILVKDFLPPPENLADFGLQTPANEIIFTGADGEISISIGEKDEKFYAQISGEPGEVFEIAENAAKILAGEIFTEVEKEAAPASD